MVDTICPRMLSGSPQMLGSAASSTGNDFLSLEQPNSDDYFPIFTAIDNIIGPTLDASSVFSNAAHNPGSGHWPSSHFNFLPEESQLPQLSPSEFEASLDELSSLDQMLSNDRSQRTWGTLHDKRTRPNAERAASASTASGRSASYSEPGRMSPLMFTSGSRFLDATQQQIFNQLSEYFHLEASRPWRNLELSENTRISEINNSVTILCDFTDSVLNKYRDARYQPDFSNGRPEANIAVMMAYTLISRVLTIYRAFCQVLIEQRLSLQQQQTPFGESNRARPSLKKKASSQVQFVGQLAIAEFHLQQLSSFFHANEFADCLNQATMESGARCLQDLQRTIHETVADVRRG